VISSKETNPSWIFSDIVGLYQQNGSGPLLAPEEGQNAQSNIEPFEDNFINEFLIAF